MMIEDPKQPDPQDEVVDPTVETPEASGAADAASERTIEDRLAELEDRIRRQQAEFVNETKRIQRQADERGRYAAEGLISDLLPVFDALHSAREDFRGRVRSDASADQANETAAAALQGFDLVEKDLLNVLGRHGVTRIETDGQAFDPGLHHAILMMDDPDLPAGAIARELRPGFLLNDRVVRPAHVAVVPPREDSSTGTTEASDDAPADSES